VSGTCSPPAQACHCDVIAGCTVNSWFRYLADTKTCFRRIWETELSVADDTVDRLYRNCYDMKDAKTCEGRTPVLIQQFGTYMYWTPDLGGGQCSLSG
jgi:hypothetical protein